MPWALIGPSPTYAEALISSVLERLISVGQQQIREEVNLVRGLDAEIQSLKHTFRSLQDVMEDAERRQVKDSSVQCLLEELKEMACQVDDVVDEWSTYLLRLQIQEAENSAATSQKKCLLSPFTCLKQLSSSRPDIAQSILKHLDAIDRDRNRFQFAPIWIEKPLRPMTAFGIDVSEVRGREMDEQTIVALLLGENMSKRRPGPYIVSIVGAGGIGKTTTLLWRPVLMQEYGSPSLTYTLLKPSQNSREFYKKKLILLVLDDVWNEDYGLWEQFLG